MMDGPWGTKLPVLAAVASEKVSTPETVLRESKSRYGTGSEEWVRVHRGVG